MTRFHDFIFGKGSDDPVAEYKPEFWANYGRQTTLCLIAFFVDLLIVLWFGFISPEAVFSPSLSEPLALQSYGEGVGAIVFALVILPILGLLPLVFYLRHRKLRQVFARQGIDAPSPLQKLPQYEPHGWDSPAARADASINYFFPYSPKLKHKRAK